MIVMIDTGTCNIRSVRNAFERNGAADSLHDPRVWRLENGACDDPCRQNIKEF